MSKLLNLPKFYLTRSATLTESPMLTRLRAERESALEFVSTTVDNAEGRDLSPTELETLDRSKTRVGEIDAQIKPLADFEALRAASAQGSQAYRASGQPVGAGAQVRSREFEYATAGHVLADAARAAGPGGDPDATARLESAGLRIVEGQLTRAVAPKNTTVEIPGVMPVTIQGAILSNLDAARPFVASVGPQDMGSIPGKVFSRPIITQHTLVGAQVAELDELSNRQFKIGGIDFSKVTRGGWALVSRQSIDWAAPSAWNALLTDFQNEYAIDSEAFAVGVFNAAVLEVGAIDVPLAPTFVEIITALYSGAAKVYAVRKMLAGLQVWQSVDQWATFGAVIDATKIGASGNGGVQSGAFGGSMLDVPRVVVPALPAGTTIIGPADRVEVYENRIGFLSAISPRVLGTEIAYGGNIAAGVLVEAGGTSPFFRMNPAGI